MNHPLLPVSLESIRGPIVADLAEVDEVIRRRLASDVVLIRTVASYIVESGGKPLRPALLPLAANACQASGNAKHQLAAVIEVIHTATLPLHAVVDEPSWPRGRKPPDADVRKARLLP